MLYFKDHICLILHLNLWNHEPRLSFRELICSVSMLLYRYKSHFNKNCYHQIPGKHNENDSNKKLTFKSHFICALPYSASYNHNQATTPDALEKELLTSGVSHLDEILGRQRSQMIVFNLSFTAKRQVICKPGRRMQSHWCTWGVCTWAHTHMRPWDKGLQL